MDFKNSRLLFESIFSVKLLFLAHRLPYPPNKGDKIRSYNELLFLAKHFEVDVLGFIDSREDAQYLPVLQKFCKSAEALYRNRWHWFWRLCMGFLKGQSLSVSLYYHGGMAQKVKTLVQKNHYDHIFVFSGQMAQYVKGHENKTVLDFCDVDSHKWDNYAEKLPAYKAWFFRLEAKRLLVFESAYAKRLKHSLFITDAERAIFLSLGGKGQIGVLPNGVDTDFFQSQKENHVNGRILFTGAMDYFPNEEGMLWFVREVWDSLYKLFPTAQLIIAGSNPTAKLQALANKPGIEVTGYLQDMRAEQVKAHIVIVPLRIARGMQNKVLEAMACGKAVIATQKALGGIHPENGKHLLIANTPQEFLTSLIELLDNPARVTSLGLAARAHMVDNFSWEKHLNKSLLPLFSL